MTLPPELHKAILAGTARVAPDGAGAGAPLSQLLAGVAAEQRLWASVAATDLWQRAGFLPSPAVPLPAPASAGAAHCTLAAASELQLLLRGIHAGLLEHWLDLAAEANQEIPHDALVSVLELGMRQATLRPAIGRLLGARGHWLAAQHPDWRDAYLAATADPAQEWELGTPPRRLHALHQLRAADPAGALALLAGAWALETPESRAALLPALDTGLSLADEAFLEAALDDKRKEVRAAARALLVSLPGSQLRQRCAARLASFFSLKPGPDAALPMALDITLPDKCDKAMKRDGAGSGFFPGLGEKATWLVDLMQAVPPEHWSASWQLPPATVLAIMAATEYKTALVFGLVSACATTLQAGSAPEARLWLTTLIEQAGKHANVHPGADLGKALSCLPLHEQEAVVRYWLDQDQQDDTAFSSAIEWARRLSGQRVSPAVSQLLLAAAQRHMRLQPRHALVFSSHLANLGRVLDAADTAYVYAGWPEDSWEFWPQWRSLVDALIDTMKIRHTMLESFTTKDNA